jgi:hypothetical protein
MNIRDESNSIQFLSIKWWSENGNVKLVNLIVLSQSLNMQGDFQRSTKTAQVLELAYVHLYVF